MQKQPLKELEQVVTAILLTKDTFLSDKQGKTFADVVNDPSQPFDVVLEFFSSADRQRRMEEAELHHERAPLAGVVRELEALPAIDQYLSSPQVSRNTRFRQAVGVVVRIVMESRGWKKTGRKGSLGVRASGSPESPAYNNGGLAFWFCRAERYELDAGMPFRSVRQRCADIETTTTKNPRTRKQRLKKA